MHAGVLMNIIRIHHHQLLIPKGSKFDRAASISGTVNHGQIAIAREAPWNDSAKVMAAA